MKRKLILASLIALLTGCVSQPQQQGEASLPEGFRVNIVTARDVVQGRGPVGVADYFSMEGKVVVYMAFTWTDIAKPWGKQPMEFRWFNGDRLIRKGEIEINFPRSPHYAWSTVIPTALGAGDCRIEVYWRGEKIAQRAFRVFDSTGPKPGAPSGTAPA